MTGRVGEVMGYIGTRVCLRPLGGGREWEAAPDRLEPVPPEEVLRLKVQVANDRSLGRGGWAGEWRSGVRDIRRAPRRPLLGLVALRSDEPDRDGD
ncbi:hypothetical protein NKH77_40540 [Streptomyces sp. M19]